MEIAGKLVPSSRLAETAGVDGQVSRPKALLFMQHLKAYALSSKGEYLFRSTRKLVRQIREILTSENNEANKARLQVVSDKNSSAQVESIVRDLIEARENAGLAVNFTRADLGLKDHDAAEKPMKMQFIEKYPEWAVYIEDPVIGIPKLFQEENWALISTFLDANIDSEINKIIFRQMFDRRATGGMKAALQLAILENPKSNFYDLVMAIQSLPFEKDPTWLEFIALHTNKEGLHKIAEIFAKPSILKLNGPRKALFSRDSQVVIGWILDRLRLNEPIDDEMDRAIVEVLEKSEWYQLIKFPWELFRHPELASKKFFRVACEKFDSRALEKMKVPDFSKYPLAKIYFDAVGIRLPNERKAFIDEQLELLNPRPRARARTCRALFTSSARP